MEKTVGKILYTEKQIADRAKEIANQINEEFSGEEVLILGTLKGSVMWLSELVKHINLDAEIDFISISSYGSNTKSSGNFELRYEPSTPIDNKNVIVIEDIVDTGRTVDYIYKYFASKNVKKLRICTMLNKPSRREIEVNVDYIGFEVDDLFIVGYGLDFNQKYRTLPYITYLEEK